MVTGDGIFFSWEAEVYASGDGRKGSYSGTLPLIMRVITIMVEGATRNVLTRDELGGLRNLAKCEESRFVRAKLNLHMAFLTTSTSALVGFSFFLRNRARDRDFLRITQKSHYRGIYRV